MVIEIRTGYFAKVRQYANAGYLLVSIANKRPWFIPKDLQLIELRHLAPPDDLLLLRKEPERYTEEYKHRVLANLNPQVMMMRFKRIATEHNADKIVLLCYEATGKFCHRHLVADWLRRTLKIPVGEL